MALLYPADPPGRKDDDFSATTSDFSSLSECHSDFSDNSGDDANNNTVTNMSGDSSSDDSMSDGSMF